MITAKVVADSLAANNGVRLVTLELEYPRMIHSEMMTHRQFSRNASSTRAIPINKAVEIALFNKVYPTFWYKNQAGMKAKKEEIDQPIVAEVVWNHMILTCTEGAMKLANLGLHKQWAGRCLEWFSHIKVLVTSTEWDNFFTLRDHPDAQPEIQGLARAIKQAMAESTPITLKEGEWHLPYIELYRDTYGNLHYLSNGELISLEDAKAISASCCAQVSYRKLDNSKDKAKEIFNKLISMKPAHASPVEHQATPIVNLDQVTAINPHTYERWCNNFKGWQQFRHQLGV
jgi:hypothetical protein